jgi:hypothetical protein
MASVSARFNVVGGTGFVDVAVVCEGCAGIVSVVCGTATAAGLVEVVVASEACAVLFVAAGAATAGGSVLISTGLDDSSSCTFSVRDPTAACCGLLCAAVDGWSAPTEAMVADISPSHDVSGDSDGKMRGEKVTRVWSVVK